MLPQATIQRYQPGGDIYLTLAGRYGSQAADKIAVAALTGDRGNITNAIDEVKNGLPLEDSTSTILLDQLANDPLAAPLAAADKALNQIFASTTGKVVTVVAIVAVVVVLAIYLPKPPSR